MTDDAAMKSVTNEAADQPDGSDVDARDAALTTVRAMLSGEKSLVDGCREIVRLLRTLDPELAATEAGLTFVAVDSEADDYVVGEARTQWNSVALRERDAQLETYLESVKHAVLQACLEFEQRLSDA